MNNIENRTKTILFASLIAVMIAPFSGINHADAEKTPMTNEQRQSVERLQELEELIEDTNNQSTIDSLKAEQQNILQTLYDNVSDVKRYNAVKGESQFQNTRNSATDLFNLSGVHKGCDNDNEVWNYEVDYARGGTWLTVDQWFPTILTSGESPYCEEHDWDSNVYVEIARIWDGQGCVSNLDVEQDDEYLLNCGTVLSGIYIVSVTADYDGEQTSAYTWFWV